MADTSIASPGASLEAEVVTAAAALIAPEAEDGTPVRKVLKEPVVDNPPGVIHLNPCFLCVGLFVFLIVAAFLVFLFPWNERNFPRRSSNRDRQFASVKYSPWSS